MTRTMKICSVLLVVYCAMCAVVLVCMPLYTAFYPSVFSDVCFRMGMVLTLLCAVNPMGLVSAIVSIASCAAMRSRGGKPSVWVMLWVAAGPFLAVAGWVLAICSFVHHSGGV